MMIQHNVRYKFRRLLWALGLTVAGLVLLAPGTAGAQELAPPVTAPARAACWLARDGLPLSHVRAADALLGGTDLIVGYDLRVPWSLARGALNEPGGSTISPAALARAGVPLWRVAPAAPAAQPGAVWTLRHGENGCLPAPLLALEMSAQPVVRGRTALLVMATDRVTFCQMELFDQRAPCYRGADGRYYALLGISALVEPGVTEVGIHMVAGGEELSFALPLNVAPGNYGFQYIDPPPSLHRLLDVELRDAEERYLMSWRALRSPERMWELPLTYPLAYPAAISADYGDRRSYGGVVSGYHSGVDYRAGAGSAVLAPADGVVVMAETLETRGHAVLIDHGWGLVTGYWHLSQIDVAVGDPVRRGDVFAWVGSTGLSTGPHLHWEVWMNGVSVDGKQWLEAHLGGVPVPPLPAPEEVPTPEAPAP